jgi:hypothetical protein
MHGIEVPDSAVGIFRENGDGGILPAVGFFAAKSYLNVFEPAR